MSVIASEIAAEFAADWFTMAPKHRTKANLAKQISDAIEAYEKAKWIEGLELTKK